MVAQNFLICLLFYKKIFYVYNIVIFYKRENYEKYLQVL